MLNKTAPNNIKVSLNDMAMVEGIVSPISCVISKLCSRTFISYEAEFF